MYDVVIIPAYKPDETLLELIDELSGSGFKLLVVDDGSGGGYAELFERAAQKAAVVTSPVNRGKGAALKRGIAALADIYPDCGWFITADADGQHRAGDIARVRDELHGGAGFVLTVRKLGGSVPARSRIGNSLSRHIYTTLTGHYFADNQSGLRGFAAGHAAWLLDVGGDKYDYEMNVLYYADKQGVQITTIPIETVYINGNASSHFDPVIDTIRIYRRLLQSAWASFAALLAGEIVVLALSITIGYRFVYITLPSVGVLTALICVGLNRFVVFRGVEYADATRMLLYTLLRYTAYTAGCMMLSMFDVPLFAAFNLIAAAMVPLEYLLHKAMHTAQYRDVNKER